MRKLFNLTFVLVFSFFLLTMVYGLWTAQAAVPHLINYQGQLTNKDNKPLDGTYKLTFKVYDAESGGNLLSEELFDSVFVEKGVFSVLLGSGKAQNGLPLIGALAFDKPYFLEIKVGDEIISPRQRLTSTGYAIRAENVDSIPRGIITMWSGTVAMIPSGWALCDGANGTPDLRDKFIIGAKQDDGGVAKTNVSGSLTQSGGAATKDISHTHTGRTESSNDVHSNKSSGGDNVIDNGHSHPFTTASGGSFTQDVLNPYFALAFIMKQ